MEKMISREAALALLRQYNQEPFHIQHALTVEAVMRWFANDLGYGEEAAMRNASRTVSASSSTSRTTKLCLVIGMVMPAM